MMPQATFATTILGLIGIGVAALVDHKGTPSNVGKLQVRAVTV